MDPTKVPRMLWQHPNVKSTEMWKFKTTVEEATGESFADFNDLYQYSITHRPQFWLHCFRFFPLVYSGNAPPLERVFNASAPMSQVENHNWFPGVKLNWAENLLYTGEPGSGVRTKRHKEDDKVAITEVREGGMEKRNITWKDLRIRTARLAQAMKARGVTKGDRVAVVASNSLDTLVVLLAITTLGGIFSSSSTDVGIKGNLDRLLQIRPKWVFFDDFAVYNGKAVDLRQKMRDVVEGMSGIREFEGVVSMPRFLDRRAANISAVSKATKLREFLGQFGEADEEPEFVRGDFSTPFIIVYSSGTTGSPKCIVHGAGNCIISASKEFRLHRTTSHKSKVLQFTTTGWIMYLSNPYALMVGASVVLYDGSPFIPDLTTLIKLASSERVTHFGISPRYLQELEKNGIVPKEVANLEALEVVTSTGMVLSDALFEWFYDIGFPENVHLDNISGGTDIAGAFGSGNPLDPLYVGGCQGLCLGTPTVVYDATIEGGSGVHGRPVKDGVPGELVAFSTFPNMPVAFWGENGKQKYFDSYFSRYREVWTHGDFVMVHPVTKQIAFLGRADGVLNPSGVRFGSGEIYGILEKHFSVDVQDSICVGQRRPQDSDETVMLFILMRQGRNLTMRLIQDIKSTIRKELSPRHVPKYIIETPAIPVSIVLRDIPQS